MDLYRLHSSKVIDCFDIHVVHFTVANCISMAIKAKLNNLFSLIIERTGCLRIKCPIGQNAISLQPEEFIVSKFQVL